MLENGTIVAGYRVDGVLGEGGMGTVYRATQLSLNRTVALKLLSTELSQDAGFRERFRREGQLQAAIEHLHIVTVYEAGDSPTEGLFIAMRLIEGVTLKSLIGAGELDVRRVLRLLTQVAGALDAAHERGLIHRDIKPQNILIGQRDHAYLADFGLTKASADSGDTEVGRFIGTIDYVSPEQARGEGASSKSDIYALTGVLCECLTGDVPYPRPTEPAVLYAHLADPPPKLSERRGGLPAAIDDVVERGLAKDPADRPDSATRLMLDARRAFALPAVIDDGDPLAGLDGSGERGIDPMRSARTVPARAQSSTAGETRLARVMDAQAPAAAAAAAPAAAPAAADLGDVDVAAGSATAGRGTAATGAPAARRRLIVPGLALLALVAAAAGVVLGAPAQRPVAPLLGSASAGDLAVSYPTSWARVDGPPQVPSISFNQPIVLAPRAAPSSRLVAGEVSAQTPQLLPASLLGSLTAPLAPGEPVALGGLEAERYVGLAARASTARLTVYVVPTTAGVATIACAASPSAPTTFAGDCERIAATLQLSGTTAYPLGPSATYASALRAVFAKLATARASAETKLAAAHTPGQQAQAASALAAAYRDAGRAVGALTVSPSVAGLNAALAAELAGLAGAYSAAASAAGSGQRGGYQSASSGVTSQGAKLAASLRSLSALGYSTSG
ncbi:MAG TPA: serine/threonine-protein kinase [Solirubrobacteraceae bacterium]|jgi:hypothetical protein|nr:serine/threonine-protein kinase [Solirubrobacteraceae bacterium]